MTTNAPSDTRRSLRPLTRLLPYLLKHKGMVLAALAALFSAAIITLVLPAAVRRMIDFGFGADDPVLVNSYFAVLIGVVCALACASSVRYFLVMWLGERVVAEVRADVFSHMTRLSPSFYDSAKSGEILSPVDCRHNPDQSGLWRKRILGNAEHNHVHRRLGDDGGNQSALVSYCARGDPGHPSSRSSGLAGRSESARVLRKICWQTPQPMPGKCSDQLGHCKLSRTKAAAPGSTDLLWKRRLPLRARR